MINRFKKSINVFFEKESIDFIRNPVVNHEFNIEDLKAVDVTFLVTVGRSGTKSLIDYLRNNSQFFAVHSPQPCLATLGSLLWMSEVEQSSAQWAYFSTREFYLVESYKRGLLFVDGDCKNLPLLPALSSFFPNSKFVHVVRNPVKFIRSGLNRGYYLEKNPIFWGHLCSTSSDLWARDLEDQIRLIAEFWEIGNVIAEEIQEKVGKKRFVTLKSEDMFRNSKEVEKAFNAIGIDHFNITKPLPKLNKNKREKYYDDDMILSIIKNSCPSARKYYPELFV